MPLLKLRTRGNSFSSSVDERMDSSVEFPESPGIFRRQCLIHPQTFFLCPPARCRMRSHVFFPSAMSLGQFAR